MRRRNLKSLISGDPDPGSDEFANKQIRSKAGTLDATKIQERVQKNKNFTGSSLPSDIMAGQYKNATDPESRKKSTDALLKSGEVTLMKKKKLRTIPGASRAY